MHEERVISPRDGCTLFPDHPDWIKCCNDHDDDYWNACLHEGHGTGETRSSIDRKFRECIRAGGHPKVAWIAWIGVRAFGWMIWYRYRRCRKRGDKRLPRRSRHR